MNDPRHPGHHLPPRPSIPQPPLQAPRQQMPQPHHLTPRSYPPQHPPPPLQQQQQQRFYPPHPPQQRPPGYPPPPRARPYPGPRYPPPAGYGGPRGHAPFGLVLPSQQHRYRGQYRYPRYPPGQRRWPVHAPRPRHWGHVNPAFDPGPFGPGGPKVNKALPGQPQWDGLSPGERERLAQVGRGPSLGREYTSESLPGSIPDEDEEKAILPRKDRSSDGDRVRFRKGGKVAPEKEADSGVGVVSLNSAEGAFEEEEEEEEEEGKVFARKRFEAKGQFSIAMTRNEKNWRRNVKWQRLKGDVKDALSVVVLWHRVLKRIESNYGVAVVNYFIFVRWLLMLNFLIFLLLLIFVITPQFFFPANMTDYLQRATVSLNDTSSAEAQNAFMVKTCSTKYADRVAVESNYSFGSVNTLGSTSQVTGSFFNSTKEAVQPFLDFLQGTGFMENTVMFYGRYDGGELKLNDTEIGIDFDYNIPVAYIVTILACFLLSLFLMIRNSASGVKEQLMNSAEDIQYQFCLISFTSWDHNITVRQNAELKKKDILNDILAEISEHRHAEARKSRTTCDWIILVLLRIVTNVLVIGIMVAAAYGIYLAVDYSLQGNSAGAVEFFNADGNESFTTYWRLLMDFMPSLVMTAANLVIPPLMDFLAEREKWTPLFEMKVKLTRLVFLKLASIAVLVYSFYTQVVCEKRTDDCNLCILDEKKEGPQCWETYVGQQLYRLCLVDFITSVLITLFVEWPRRAIAKRCGQNRKSLFWRLLGDVTFSVHRNVLDLVYTQTIFWFSFFYAPLMTVVAICYFFFTFYRMRFSLRNSVPERKSYKASGSTSFFMIVLLLSFILIIIPVFYSILFIPPSKSCGPFRLNAATMWDSIRAEIAAGPVQLRTALSIVGSTTVAVPVIVMLVLLVYYFQALGSAHQALGQRLKEQLVLESQDKQFLIRMMQHMDYQNQNEEEESSGIEEEEKKE